MSCSPGCICITCSPEVFRALARMASRRAGAGATCGIPAVAPTRRPGTPPPLPTARPA